MPTPPVSVQWLGINAVRFTYQGRVTLLDPYVTRNPNASSDPAYLKKHLPAADRIVISHSHWDHLADTPTLALQTGATVIGSETTINICRAHGVPESQLVSIQAGDVYGATDVNVRFLPSRHALMPSGEVAYAGTYTKPPQLPLRRQDYLEGGTFAPLFQFGEHRILDLGSANYVEQALVGIHCDLLLVSIARMENTPDFLPRLLARVSPRRVVPVHFDNFTRPLEQGLSVQPYCDLQAFTRAMQRLAPHIPVQVPDLFDGLALS